MHKFTKLNARGIATYNYSLLSSTNEWAKYRLMTGATAPFLVTARQQTAGHGKFTRKFYSPAGSGAYFTLALPSQLAISEAHLTVTAAVAAYEVLSSHFARPLSIKWVNDLYCSGRKVTGILAEAAVNNENHVCGTVIGWGINLAAPAKVPAELRSQISWLSATPVSDCQRLAIIEAITARFWDLLTSCPWSQVLQVYRNHQFLAGKNLVVDTGRTQVVGYFDHLTDDGYLSLRTPQGMQVFTAGTVRELPG